MSIAPKYVPLTIYQGATFVEEFHCYTQATPDAPLVPVNLTGYTARMQIRTDIDAADVLVDFTADLGRVEITPELGRVTVRLRAASTGALSFPRGVYDLELEAAGGEVYRIAEGPVTLSKQVTR